MKVDTADKWDANQGSEEHVEDVCGQDGRCQTAIVCACMYFCNSNSLFGNFWYTLKYILCGMVSCIQQLFFD